MGSEQREGSQRGFAKTREECCGPTELRMMVSESRAVRVGMESIGWTQELVGR